MTKHYKQRMAEITSEVLSDPKPPTPLPSHPAPRAAGAPKDFYEGLCEEYVVMSGRYQGEINRLRAKVRELEAQIGAMPSTLTDMQDRIVMLESRLAAK